MLQVNTSQRGPFKIKSIRKVTDKEHNPAGSACSLQPADGTDKPPC